MFEHSYISLKIDHKCELPPHPGRRLLRKLISQPEYQNGTFLPREMEPVLFCERFVYDPGDMAPPEYNVGYYHSDKFTYSIEISPRRLIR